MIRAAALALFALLALNGCVNERVTLKPEQREHYTELSFETEFDKLPYEQQIYIRDNLTPNLNKLPVQEQCEKGWNFLWSLSKLGNIEARQLVGYSLAIGPRHFPGRAEHEETWLHDKTILFIHMLGDEKPARNPAQQRANYIKHLSDSPPYAGKNPRFRECLLHNELTDCSRIAVEEKLVPSFEEFAAEIDAAGPEAVTEMCHDALEKSNRRNQFHQ